MPKFYETRSPSEIVEYTKLMERENIPLKATRKKDREEMAGAMKAIASQMGAEFKVNDNEHRRGLQISVTGPRGFCVSLGIYGDSVNNKNGIFVMAWYVNHKYNTKLHRNFGEVNDYHYQKATHVCYGFWDVLHDLKRGLEMANDGSAFVSNA